MAQSMKFAGNPVLYNVDVKVIPATDNWLNVTNLDGNGDPYWYGVGATVFNNGMWSRASSQPIRIRTFIVEGPTIPFWDTTIPLKFRITVGDNTAGIIEPAITVFTTDGVLDPVVITPNSVVTFDYTSLAGVSEISSPCTISKIEVLLPPTPAV